MLRPGAGGGTTAGPVNLKVHSVFRRVVNLYQGEWFFSLARRGTGNAPGFLVLDLPENIDFITLGLLREMPVSLAGGRLSIGEALVVDCRRLRLWPGRPRASLAWEGRSLAGPNLRALLAAIYRWGNGKGIRDIIGRPDGHLLTGALECLHRGLCYSGEEDLAAAVRGILGYGPGLTPAGDDLLVGLLAAAGTGAGYRACLPRLHRAIIVNLDRTTAVSASILRQIMAGDYHEYLQEVLYAVTRGMPENVTGTARKLLGLGGTSGTDIATGLYLAFTWQVDEYRQAANKPVI